MRFDDLEYVKQYNKTGKFPKIHDDIALLDEYVPEGVVLDLGCCTGLLACRLAQKHKHVIGIEPNKQYLANAVRKENVNYVNLKICEQNMEQLKEILNNWNVTCVYARRVLPEICDAGGTKLVRSMLAMFKDCGVKHIVIEGRKCSKNSTHLLKSIEREKEMFSGLYVNIHNYKNCSLFTIL